MKSCNSEHPFSTQLLPFDKIGKLIEEVYYILRKVSVQNTFFNKRIYIGGQAGSLWEQRGCETSYFLSIDMPTHDESKITYECLKIKGEE